MEIIATLPAAHHEEIMVKIMWHDAISAVRYNTGCRTPFSPKENLEIVNRMAKFYGKKLWIDLKGRQLRIVKWAAPDFGRILLNHQIEIGFPAKVKFRNDENWYRIIDAKRNEIFVDPIPRHAIGSGQAVNIIAEQLDIQGYLTRDDKRYIKAACELGIFNFMLSFVESEEDVQAVKNEIFEASCDVAEKDIQLGLKIESAKGMEYVATLEKAESPILVAARDDLATQLEEDKEKLKNACAIIIQKNPAAIFASRIFEGLEARGVVGIDDVLIIKEALEMGYRNFMLSDNICRYQFDSAMAAWEKIKTILKI